MQFDEKWAFVAKKAEHCDPSDARHGDSWDHVAFDPEHRLVVAVVPGKRTAANCRRLVAEFARRTRGRVMALMTSDDYPSYKVAILDVYGHRSIPLRILNQRGRGPQRSLPYKRPPPALNYVRLCKRRENGRVVKVDVEVVYGTDASVRAALGRARRRAARPTSASSNVTTAPTATATRARAAGPTASPRTGRCTRR